jgi:TolB-like protein
VRWAIIVLAAVFISSSVIFTLFRFDQRNHLFAPAEGVSIAVLPFEGLNTSKYEEYFSDGITGELIQRLTKIPNLRAYLTVDVPKQANHQENNKSREEKYLATYLLKGSIKKTDNEIQLYLQLNRIKDNKNVWKAKYNGKLQDIYSIQDCICEKISEICNVSMSQNDAVFSNKNNFQDYSAFDNYLKGIYIQSKLNNDRDDPWRLYFQGKYHEGKPSRESNEIAISLFNQAIEIDNNFAPAYIGLAQCYSNYINFNWDFDKKWLVNAENYAEKAHSISADLPEYYCTLIKIKLLKEFFSAENERISAFEIAQEGISKYPNHPQLNSIFGYCFYLKFGTDGNKSDFDKALQYKEKSFWMNPYDIGNIVYAKLLMLNREFDKAIEVCKVINRDDSSSMVNFLLGEIYYFKGDVDKSKTIFQQFDTPLEFKITSLYYLAMISCQTRRSDEAQNIIREINRLSPHKFNFFENRLKLASIYFGRGDRELGYHYLKSFFEESRAKENHYIYHRYIELDKNFDKFKEEEDFKKTIKTGGLEDGKKQNY